MVRLQGGRKTQELGCVLVVRLKSEGRRPWPAAASESVKVAFTTTCPEDGRPAVTLRQATGSGLPFRRKRREATLSSVSGVKSAAVTALFSVQKAGPAMEPLFGEKTPSSPLSQQVWSVNTSCQATQPASGRHRSMQACASATT